MASPETPGSYVPLTSEIELQQVSPILIGTLMSFGLFGIGVLQFYYVFRQLDLLRTHQGGIGTVNMFQAAMAALLFVSDVADTILKGSFIDQYVRQAIVGGMTSMQFLPKTAFAICFNDGWIAFITHVIYTARLLRVNRNQPWIWGVAGLAMSLSVAQFVSAIVTGVRSWGPVTGWVHTVAVSAKLWLAGAAVCDIILCLVFVWSIARHRTAFNDTNYVITRWTAFTIETGLLTSAMQITELILFIAYPNIPYHLVLGVILPKLYVISILVMLNTVYANKLNTLSTAFPNSTTTSVSRTGFGGRASSVTSRMGDEGMEKKSNVTSGIQITSEIHTHQQDPFDMPETRRGFTPEYGGAYRAPKGSPYGEEPV